MSELEKKAIEVCREYGLRVFQHLEDTAKHGTPRLRAVGMVSDDKGDRLMCWTFLQHDELGVTCVDMTRFEHSETFRMDEFQRSRMWWTSWKDGGRRESS